MNAAPKVILLDTNAYLRLARTIPSLLAGTFGAPPPFSLYVLAELDNEYNSSQRLKAKFEWVCEPQYQQDRAGKRYKCAGKMRPQVENAFTFLAAYAREHTLNVSREDIMALAVGAARGFSIVGDDGDMRKLAEAHGIEYWSVIKLLHVMVTKSRLTMADVKEALQYMDYENDLPMPKAVLKSEFKKLFGIDCPI
jgi:hypothetical protein